jgi:hypothetical protein
LRTSSDVLAFYESRFGRYRFDQFTSATVEGIFARRSVAGGVIYEPRYLADELRTTGHDAHEQVALVVLHHRGLWKNRTAPAR